MLPAQRPVFLNFARIRFPVGSVASFGHRVSGLVLFLLLPLAVLALQRSLERGAALPLPGRMGAALVAWACAHHLFAGIRHLLHDVGVGASLSASRKSASAALLAAAAVGLAALLA